MSDDTLESSVPEPSGEPRIVFTTADANEALLIKSILEGSGLQVILFDEHFSRLESPLAFAIGGVKVVVPASQEEAAKEALEEYRGAADQDPVRGRNSPLDATEWHAELDGDDEDEDDVSER